MCASFVFTQTFPAVHVFVSWFLNLSSFLVSGFQVCRWVCMNTSCSSCVLACPSSSHFASLAWLHGTVVYCYKKYAWVFSNEICELFEFLKYLCVFVCVRTASWQHLPHAGGSWQPGDRRGQGVCHHTQHQCQVQCCTPGEKPYQLHEELPAPHRYYISA